MLKNYVLDTNILIDNPDNILILRNGSENSIYIPYSVLCELDRLKSSNRFRTIVSKISSILIDHKDIISILISKSVDYSNDLVTDEIILKEIMDNPSIDNPILITNDSLLRFKAIKLGISAQKLESSQPFESESEIWTGISGIDSIIPNSFVFNGDIPFYYKTETNYYPINCQNNVWNIIPLNQYQNFAITLLLDNELDLITIQGKAGYGKTFLALAAAFHLVLQKKDNNFNKIYILKSSVEIGKNLGYRPGNIERKIEPIIRPIMDLILKLHQIRPANKLFLDGNANYESVNHDKLEILPLNFIRGMNIEDGILIIDEGQNLSRAEMRSVLTRCGNNVKTFICGDINQIDNPYLNKFNNGLNWVVKLCKGKSNYGHIVLKGSRSRGRITDLILKVGL